MICYNSAPLTLGCNVATAAEENGSKAIEQCKLNVILLAEDQSEESLLKLSVMDRS